LVDVQNAWFKKNRFQQQKAKKMNVGGAGLGQRERPGLGAKNVRPHHHYHQWYYITLHRIFWCGL